MRTLTLGLLTTTMFACATTPAPKPETDYGQNLDWTDYFVLDEATGTVSYVIKRDSEKPVFTEGNYYLMATPPTPCEYKQGHGERCYRYPLVSGLEIVLTEERNVAYVRHQLGQSGCFSFYLALLVKPSPLPKEEGRERLLFQDGSAQGSLSMTVGTCPWKK